MAALDPRNPIVTLEAPLTSYRAPQTSCSTGCRNCRKTLARMIKGVNEGPRGDRVAGGQAATGIVPISSYCKQVRDDQSLWQGRGLHLEDAGDQSSQGICPGFLRRRDGKASRTKAGSSCVGCGANNRDLSRVNCSSGGGNCYSPTKGAGPYKPRGRVWPGLISVGGDIQPL